MNVFANNIEEIAASRRLQFIGLALALVHVASWIFFNTASGTFLFSEPAVCWHFFSSCEWWTSLWRPLKPAWQAVYLTTAITTGLLFLFKRVKWAYLGLISCFGLKGVAFFADYRMMGNYHYMHHLFELVFLLIPGKKDGLRLILVGFYMSAGVIKFNSDWLSGEALTRPPWIVTGWWLELLCAYVIILEIFVSQLLLSPRTILRRLALIQFFCFHVFSFSVVGWFYPAVMFLMLTVFLWFDEGVRVRAFFLRPLNALLGVMFLVAQLLPLWLEPKSAITGALRTFSMNMMDARARCTAVVVTENEHRTSFERLVLNAGIRLRCDPLHLLPAATHRCQMSATDTKVSLFMASRMQTQVSPYLELFHRDLCNHPVQYQWNGRLPATQFSWQSEFE
jgi:hypothetical protein